LATQKTLDNAMIAAAALFDRFRFSEGINLRIEKRDLSATNPTRHMAGHLRQTGLPLRLPLRFREVNRLRNDNNR
jgi:hypothetical protein